MESFSLLAAALNLLSATQTVVELKIQKPSLLENTQDVWSRNIGLVHFRRQKRLEKQARYNVT